MLAVVTPQDSPTPEPPSPLERLDAKDASVLGDAELLELLGVRTEVQLREVLQSAPDELAGRLGRATAARVLAAMELGRRCLRARDARPRLSNPREIYEYLVPQLAGLRTEVFHVLSLSPRNVLLSDRRVAEGGVDQCTVDPREVFAPAIAARAAGIIVAHNHPSSGDPEPSTQDLALTEQISLGASVLGIRLLDHLVVGDGRFVSCLARGLISPESRASAVARMQGRR